MERLAIFVDGANLFYVQQSLGWRMDWKRFLDYFSQGQQLYNAFYYTGIRVPLPEGEESFLRALTNMGYTVRRKLLKRYTDEYTGTVVERANLNIEIAIDVFTTMDLYDRALLATGDGDFERLVEVLRVHGKRVLCVSTFGCVALELRNAVDHYVDLSELRDQLERRWPPPVESPSGAVPPLEPAGEAPPLSTS